MPADKTPGGANVGALISATGELLGTGTLIGRRTILTAAHCLEELRLTQGGVYFFQGADIAKWEMVKHRVEIDKRWPTRYERKPGFESAWNDYGIVRLADELTSNPVRLSKKALPDSAWNSPKIMVGYSHGNKRKALRLPVKRVTITAERSYLLLGDEADRRQNICNGDSGGPVFEVNPKTGEPVLLGVISKHNVDDPQGPCIGPGAAAPVHHLYNELRAHVRRVCQDEIF